MASLTIPSYYRSGLAEIIKLNDESFRELLSTLENMAPALYEKTLSDKLKASVNNIPEAEVDKIAQAIFGMSLGRVGAEVSTSQFVDDVIQSIETNNYEGLSLSNDNRDSFKQRLTSLLEANSLAIGTKAYNILFEHGQNLTSFRILTDIRPVFREQIEEQLGAALIIHTVKLEYMQEGDTKEFFVAMDTKDITELMDVLKRAQAKEESLKALLQAANVTYIDAE
jgi:uncharacterized protein (DUF1778 family)